MKHIYDLKPEQVKQLDHHGVCLTKAYKYAKNMEDGDIFPPVAISLYKGKWKVHNGAHRTMAAKLSGKPLRVISKKIMGLKTINNSKAQERKLTPLECHNILCQIAKQIQ